MLPEHFGHVTSTDAKHLTYVVAFKPASNILRKVLYCPILQMKTLRLKETGNSPTKTCCFTTITVSLIYSTPWTWFLDLQNYVVVQQMKWFLKEHMVLTSRLPVHHPVFGGRQEAPPLSRVSEVGPTPDGLCQHPQTFPSSLPSQGMSRDWTITSEAEMAQGCVNQELCISLSLQSVLSSTGQSLEWNLLPRK